MRKTGEYFEIAAANMLAETDAHKSKPKKFLLVGL